MAKDAMRSPLPGSSFFRGMSTPPRQETGPEWIVGLDLGQASDPTALAAVEKTRRPDPEHPDRTQRHYAVRHLRRWHLGTSYVQIVEDVAELLAKDPLPGCRLAVDATGVGAAVVDLFGRADMQAKLVRILITSGHKVTAAPGGFHVPKRDLAGVLQSCAGSGRLKIADSLPEAVTLQKEIRNFSVKVTTAGHEVFEALRSGLHDDLVLSVAMALWLGEAASRRFMIW
jgi:hypothetical protein